jgi:hypothetical protein
MLVEILPTLPAAGTTETLWLRCWQAKRPSFYFQVFATGDPLPGKKPQKYLQTGRWLVNCTGSHLAGAQ